MNASASDGELSITLENPTSRWIHLLVHAANVADESAEYDVRVEADSAVEDARHGNPAGLARHDSLEDVGWRYRIDPDGPSTHEDWVLLRHLHPMS